MADMNWPGGFGHRRRTRYRAGDLRAACRARCDRRCRILPRQGGRAAVPGLASGGKASVHQGNIGSHEDCERVIGRCSTSTAGWTSLSTTPASRSTSTVRRCPLTTGTMSSRSTSPAPSTCPARSCSTCWTADRGGSSYQLGDRLLRQHRPGQLRGRQVGLVRADHEPGAGNGPERDHGQLGHSWLHQHRNDCRCPASRLGEGRRQDPGRSPG